MRPTHERLLPLVVFCVLGMWLIPAVVLGAVSIRLAQRERFWRQSLRYQVVAVVSALIAIWFLCLHPWDLFGIPTLLPIAVDSPVGTVDRLVVTMVVGAALLPLTHVLAAQIIASRVDRRLLSDADRQERIIEAKFDSDQNRAKFSSVSSYRSPQPIRSLWGRVFGETADYALGLRVRPQVKTSLHFEVQRRSSGNWERGKFLRLPKVKRPRFDAAPV